MAEKDNSQGGAVKRNKRAPSLAFLSPEERKEYDNLRRYGCTRGEAITAIISVPKERACS